MKTPKQVWQYHKKFHSSFQLFLRSPLILLRIIGFQNNHVLKLDYMHYIHNSHNLLPHCCEIVFIRYTNNTFKINWQIKISRPNLLYKGNVSD